MPIFAHQFFITMRKVLFYICCLLTVIGTFCACNARHSDSGKGEGATYKTFTVRTSTQTLKTDYTAKLQGRQLVEVRPQVSGRRLRKSTRCLTSNYPFPTNITPSEASSSIIIAASPSWVTK